MNPLWALDEAFPIPPSLSLDDLVPGLVSTIYLSCRLDHFKLLFLPSLTISLFVTSSSVQRKNQIFRQLNFPKFQPAVSGKLYTKGKRSFDCEIILLLFRRRIIGRSFCESDFKNTFDRIKVLISNKLLEETYKQHK